MGSKSLCLHTSLLHHVSITSQGRGFRSLSFGTYLLHHVPHFFYTRGLETLHTLEVQLMHSLHLSLFGCWLSGLLHRIENHKIERTQVRIISMGSSRQMGFLVSCGG
mgnify:CR=1 FL=1